MHEEHKEEIKMLKDAIKHYEEVLKKPDFKYLDGSTRHEDALRIVTTDNKVVSVDWNENSDEINNYIFNDYDFTTKHKVAQ